jgi:LPS O-antigen subunit length determinant protein (WzzB/FepE family)
MVLYKLFSNSFKEEVFISNNYLKKINLDKESGNFSTVNFVNKVNKVKKAKGTSNDRNLTTFALTGKDPLIISNFLNDLLRVAAFDTLNDIKVIEQKKIDSRLSFIKTELSLEKRNMKEVRLRKINQLQKELKIAVSLKNKEFNFPQINQISNGNSLKTHAGQTKAIPIWYMYGEQALRQELDKLTSDKTVNNSKIDSLESQKAVLTSVDFVLDGIEIVGVYRSVAPATPISPKKRLIVSVMFFISLIISIFIAYLVSVIRENR